MIFILFLIIQAESELLKIFDKCWHLIRMISDINNFIKSSLNYNISYIIKKLKVEIK